MHAYERMGRKEKNERWEGEMEMGQKNRFDEKN